MAANRKTPAPSNTAGAISGVAALEDINTEVQALWQYLQVPLSDPPGGTGAGNSYLAVADVAVDLNRKGQKFTWTPDRANTGAVDLDTGAGALPLRDRVGAALTAGRLAVGRTEIVENMGTELRLVLDAPVASQSLKRSIFAYQLGTNVNGSGTAAGWNNYPLNTIILNELGLTFNAGTGQITLPAGDYDWVEGSFHYVDARAAAFLWNVTDDIPVPGIARQSVNGYTPLRFVGKFTLAAAKIVRARLYCSVAVGSTSLGTALNITSPSAQPEQYGFLVIQRYA